MNDEKDYLEEFFDDESYSDEAKAKIARIISKENGIKASTYRDRIKADWSLYDACTTPTLWTRRGERKRDYI